MSKTRRSERTRDHARETQHELDHARRIRSRRDDCPACWSAMTSYGCAVCHPPESVLRALPAYLGPRTFSEARAARRRGLTARQFFNRLTLDARRALMLELGAREFARELFDRSPSATMRWLRAGLRPGVL